MIGGRGLVMKMGSTKFGGARFGGRDTRGDQGVQRG